MASEAQENGMVKLDEELLAELEEAAKDRYTEDDEDYMKVFKCPPVKPPVLPAEPHNRNRRDRDHRVRGNRYRGGWQDNRSGGYRDDSRQDYNGGRQEGHRDERRHYYREDRRYDDSGKRDDRRQGFGNTRYNRDDGRNRSYPY